MKNHASRSPFYAAVAMLFVVMLFSACGGSAHKNDLRDFASKFAGKSACGLYVNDRKIGYLIETAQVVSKESKEHFEAVNEDCVRAGGDSVSVSKATFNLDNGDLESFVERRDENGKHYELSLRRDGSAGFSERTNDGEITRERHLRASGMNLLEYKRLSDWLLSMPKVGAKLMSKEGAFSNGEWKVSEVQHEYLGRETKSANGTTRTIHKIASITDGMRIESHVDAYGDIYLQRFGVFTARKEPESVARRANATDFDLSEFAHVPLDKSLDDWSNISRLVVKLKGLPRELPFSKRQKLLAKDGDWATYEFTRDSDTAAAQPLSKADHYQFVRATFAAQSDAPQIKRLASSIVGKETDPVKKAARIARYVHRFLKPDYNCNSATALDVLRRKCGDCTEAALLFTALARAADVPTRSVSGLAYAEDPKPSFCWHAWNEVHNGRRWISVDPAWDEVFIDATHIKITNDDNEDYSWITAFGLMEAKVVSVERAEHGKP